MYQLIIILKKKTLFLANTYVEIKFNEKIIHLLNDFGIDCISMAGIMGTLEQENLNENTFLNFIENKVSLTIEDCTDQIWRMRGY